MLNHIHLLLQLWSRPEILEEILTRRNSIPNQRVGSNSFEPIEPEANEFASTRGNISYVIKRIKGRSAREINEYIRKVRYNDDSLHFSSEKVDSAHLWQKDFFDFNIYTKKKFEEKLNYIHKNPVQGGLVVNPEEWVYSSWHNYYCSHPTKIKIDFIEW